VVKFKTIVADPCWSYKNKRTGGSLTSGAIDKYDTMSYDELKDLPVKDIADKNSVLFLWVTTPLKYEIATSGILEAWGFKYKTSIYWRKVMSLGLGFTFRGQVEECWFCTRGKIKSFRSQSPNIFETNCIETKVRKHSQKPEEFFQLIEPSLVKFNLNPRIELFARERRDGWTSIGNEITGNDIRVDLKELIKNEN
jgi:N6-adenosine-specific RNA methylase IME4